MDVRKPKQRLLVPALRSQPDRRLVALARDGSEPAQEEIVRRYRAALVRYGGSIVGAAAAEDVVQEALAKGMAALGPADEELRLRPWLYAIVRNTALNHLRDAGPATEQLDENYDGVEQPPQALERRERVRSLVGGMRELPHQQREALVKRELEGRSHDEIGDELGVSSGAARQLIFRARESLRVGFGSLLPMPLLKWLAEGGGDGAASVAAGASGSALAAKTAVAVFAAGAAVTAGVAIDHAGRGRPATPPAPEAAVRPAVPAPGGSPARARLEPVVATAGSGRSRSAARDNSGPGGGPSSGPGPGGKRAVEGDGGGSGSSHSGSDGGSSGKGSDDGGSHGGSSESGSGSGGGSDDAVATVPSTPAPASSSGPGSGPSTPAVEPVVEDGSSGSGSGSDDASSETSRDLSGGSVSQGSEGPD
jgi:RNA polymerase sigma factor (sigma-70 family)